MARLEPFVARKPGVKGGPWGADGMKGHAVDLELDGSKGLVGEAQLAAVVVGQGVFAEADKGFGVVAVDLVADDGVAHGRERGADLVGATGDEFGAEEGGALPWSVTHLFKPCCGNVEEVGEFAELGAQFDGFQSA